MNKHQEYMQLAIKEAELGFTSSHGGPFGACIVHEGTVIAKGHNTVLRDCDPTCHAEMNAIRNASKYLQSPFLKECILYTTSEPCPMCCTAAMWARIPTIYIGADRHIAAQFGFDDAKQYEYFKSPNTVHFFDVFPNISPDDIKILFEKWKEIGGKLY